MPEEHTIFNDDGFRPTKDAEAPKAKRINTTELPPKRFVDPFS